MKKGKGLIIIIIAALLLEIMSGIQYYSMHDMMSEQLEKRAESELTMKAILIKNMLNETENALEDYFWNLRQTLVKPDSINLVTKTLLLTNPEIMNCWVAFTPHYYSQKGRLFEPCAKRQGEEIVLYQVGGDNHDYTLMEHYCKAAESNDYHWTDPYFDDVIVTTCSKALRDKNDSLICVFGADLSLKWLNDTLNLRHIFPSSFILLLTEEGKIIMPPPSEGHNNEISQKLTALINDSSVVRTSSKSGRTKIIRFNSREMGEDGCVFYANMKGKPHWQICVVCYDREVYAQLYKLRWRFLLLNLLGFGVLLFMIGRYARNLRNLQKTTLQQERINNELHIANKIQTAMLPEMKIQSDRVEVAGKLVPAKQVGGDLYEFFVRNEKLFFCIGDVAGKGIPSALLMAMTQAIFRVVAIHENNPARIMNDINRIACQNNKANMFATLFIGVLDLPTGHLRYCNAGHDLPLMVSQFSNNEVRPLDVLPNLPVGVFSDTKYELQEEHLLPNTILFLYTDGLTEGINMKREQFGLKRVMSTLNSQHSITAVEPLLDKMISVVLEYMDGAEQRDDLTLFAIRYKGEKNDNQLLDENLVITNDIQELEKLKTFIISSLEKINVSSTVVAQLRLALEETVVNVINYAYPNNMKGDIRVNMKYDGKSIKVVIADEGVAFDPTQAAQVDTTLSAKDRPIGGLGILLVRELMDTVNYERINDKNVLTLKKNVEINSSINDTNENKH